MEWADDKKNNLPLLPILSQKVCFWNKTKLFLDSNPKDNAACIKEKSPLKFKMISDLRYKA